MERTVILAMEEGAARAGGDLLAWVVMPNHLHIVFVQGTLPLSAFMQPLLRRLAIHIHRRHKSEGHVFQRRFFSVPCTDPDYLRNSLMYVHLNPVRARLCRHPDEYPWSTHAAYTTAAVWHRTGPASALQLFTAQAGASLPGTKANYLALLEWRVRMDAFLKGAGRRGAHAPPEPLPTRGGDEHWADRFGWICACGAENQVSRRPVMDLRDFALRLLRSSEPPLELEVLRSGCRTRPLVALRRQFITRAKERGYRNRTIARFLNVSDVTVSRT